MDFSSPSFRKEVQEYLHSYGNLLEAMSKPGTPRFSKEELEMLEYSVAELQKVLVICVE
jgi:hypothetical protein